MHFSEAGIFKHVKIKQNHNWFTIHLPGAYFDRHRVRNRSVIRRWACGNWWSGCRGLGLSTSSSSASIAPSAILSPTFFVSVTLSTLSFRRFIFLFLWRFRRFWYDVYRLVVHPSRAFNGRHTKIELAHLFLRRWSIVPGLNLVIGILTK